MPVKKYFKKAATKGAKFLKKRYTTQTGGARVNKIARDLYKIKRSLNVEHKHFDFQFGSGQTVTARLPTNNVPIFQALTLPSRGTAFNNRIGNQIKITHITSKIEMSFRNTSDLVSRTTASVRLLWAKNGDAVPTIGDLYELDANGHYTRNSFVNTQSWNKFVWIKALNTFKSHQDQISRYPLSNSNANVLVSGTNISVDAPADEALNISKYYINKQTKTNITVKFQNGSDTVMEQMKPYLLFMSDVIVQSPTNHDPVSITGQIRFTYVDN
jgi:hypothetical protein